MSYHKSGIGSARKAQWEAKQVKKAEAQKGLNIWRMGMVAEAAREQRAISAK